MKQTEENHCDLEEDKDLICTYYWFFKLMLIVYCIITLAICEYVPIIGDLSVDNVPLCEYACVRDRGEKSSKTLAWCDI